MIAAAKRGARALGVEYNPDMVELSKRNAAKAGVGDKATFVQGDMYAAEFSQATVLALFLLPDNLLKLRDKFAALKPGTRIVANTFGIEEWTADETITISDDCLSWCTVLLYFVPAQVDGTWQTAQGPLTLKQQYQLITGTLGAGHYREWPRPRRRGELHRRRHSRTARKVSGRYHDRNVESRRAARPPGRRPGRRNKPRRAVVVCRDIMTGFLPKNSSGGGQYACWRVCRSDAHRMVRRSRGRSDEGDDPGRIRQGDEAGGRGHADNGEGRRVWRRSPTSRKSSRPESGNR